MTGFWDYKESGKPGNTESDANDSDDLDVGFDMDDVDADDDDDVATANDSDDDEGEVEEPDKSGDVKPDDKSNDSVKQAAEDVIKHVGGDTIIRFRGQDKPLREFTPQEIVNWISKAQGADKAFNEAAAMRKQMDKERERLEIERASLLREVEAARQSGGDKRGKGKYELPSHMLEPNELDTPETAALKQYLGAMQDRLNTLEGSFTQQDQVGRVKSIEREVDELSKEYYMASRDEVLAVKFTHPEASTEELMRLAHQYYSSSDHIRNALKANPTFARELGEEYIRQYLAKKNSAKKVPGQAAAAGSSSKRVSDSGKIPIRNFKDADIGARAFIKEMMKPDRD